MISLQKIIFINLYLWWFNIPTNVPRYLIIQLLPFFLHKDRCSDQFVFLTVHKSISEWSKHAHIYIQYIWRDKWEIGRQTNKPYIIKYPHIIYMNTYSSSSGLKASSYLTWMKNAYLGQWHLVPLQNTPVETTHTHHSMLFTSLQYPFLGFLSTTSSRFRAFSLLLEEPLPDWPCLLGCSHTHHAWPFADWWSYLTHNWRV